MTTEEDPALYALPEGMGDTSALGLPVNGSPRGTNVSQANGRVPAATDESPTPSPPLTLAARVLESVNDHLTAAFKTEALPCFSVVSPVFTLTPDHFIQPSQVCQLWSAEDDRAPKVIRMLSSASTSSASTDALGSTHPSARPSARALSSKSVIVGSLQSAGSLSGLKLGRVFHLLDLVESVSVMAIDAPSVSLIVSATDPLFTPAYIEHSKFLDYPNMAVFLGDFKCHKDDYHGITILPTGTMIFIGIEQGTCKVMGSIGIVTRELLDPITGESHRLAFMFLLVRESMGDPQTRSICSKKPCTDSSSLLPPLSLYQRRFLLLQSASLRSRTSMARPLCSTPFYLYATKRQPLQTKTIQPLPVLDVVTFANHLLLPRVASYRIHSNTVSDPLPLDLLGQEAKTIFLLLQTLSAFTESALVVVLPPRLLPLRLSPCPLQGSLHLATLDSPALTILPWPPSLWTPANITPTNKASCRINRSVSLALGQSHHPGQSGTPGGLSAYATSLCDRPRTFAVSWPSFHQPASHPLPFSLSLSPQPSVSLVSISSFLFSYPPSLSLPLLLFPFSLSLPYAENLVGLNKRLTAIWHWVTKVAERSSSLS